MKTIAFFNNKGGVGKTTLVYHLAWMLSELEQSVIAVDLDPQSNLTAAFLREERLEEINATNSTILGTLRPMLECPGDFDPTHVESITDYLGLVPGDLGLSTFEDQMADSWTRCLADNPSDFTQAFRVMSAFYWMIELAAAERKAEFALIDVGPNLGASNRAALVAADFVVVPLGADLFSVQGLSNLGQTLHEWRGGWKKRCEKNTPDGLSLPSGSMRPVGYVMIPPSVHKNRLGRAYQEWTKRIPSIYSTHVLQCGYDHSTADADHHKLATIKHYKSLMPLAQDARKPMFLLKPADGAIGGHLAAVKDCYDNFKTLAEEIVRRCGTKEVAPAQ